MTRMAAKAKTKSPRRARAAASTAMPLNDLHSGGMISTPLRSNYMQGENGVVWANWRPALRDARNEIQSSWDKAAARAIDIIQNSGWISGAIDQSIANTVGTGLRLKAAPENRLFGLDNKAARVWAKDCEQRFENYCSNPLEIDIEGRRNFGQMQAAQFRMYFAFGETFAEFPWKRRLLNGTKVRLITANRISRGDDLMRNIVQGVQMDDDGLPIAYNAVKRDKWLGDTEYLVRARDALFRTRVNHVFDGGPDQVRGITPLVPALRVAKQFDQLADATLMAALIQSVFAATIESDSPTEDMLAGLLTPQEQAKMAVAGQSIWDGWFAAQSGWYDNATVDVGITGRISHLFPGQKMEFHASEHPNGNYKEFAMYLLREIARCLGMTYESVTGDYAGATYSSVKLAVSEIFEVTKYRRKHIVAPFCQATYECWLEEEIEAGRIQFPGGLDAFYANRTAACRAIWRGTPKPVADDLKTAKSNEIYRNMGVITDEMIANDLGMDIEDVYDQRKREKEMREELGLPDMYPAPTAANGKPLADPADDNEDGPDA